jgi:cell pole-organizing protein PopZ
MSVSSSTQYNRYDDQRAAEQRTAHEPSMEEILASIRRIIADDEVLPLTRSSSPAAPSPNAANPSPASAPVQRPQPPQPPLSPSLYPQQAAVPAPTPSNAPSLDGAVAAMAGLRYGAPKSEPQAFEGVAADRLQALLRKPHPEPAVRQTSASDAPASSDLYGSHATLARDEGAPALLSPQADASIAASFQSLASTLRADEVVNDAKVTELLRPMLKQWLDDNLPVLVERLVRAEIERVARSGRDHS